MVDGARISVVRRWPSCTFRFTLVLAAFCVLVGGARASVALVLASKTRCCARVKTPFGVVTHGAGTSVDRFLASNARLCARVITPVVRASLHIFVNLIVIDTQMIHMHCLDTQLRTVPRIAY